MMTYGGRLRLLYGRSTPLVSHGGRLVSAHSKAKDSACSQAASEWRRKQPSESTFHVLAQCRAMAAARGSAGKQRAAGHEARAQALEHRASTGKVGATHRAQLADEMGHVRSARQLARAIRNQGRPPERDAIDEAKARAARLPDFNAKVAGKPYAATVAKSPVQQAASEAVGGVQAARMNFNKLRQETDDPIRLDVARNMVLNRYRAAQGPLKAARAEQAKDKARATPASPRSSEELTDRRTREPSPTIKEPWQQTRAELLSRNEQVRPNETGQPWQGARHPVGTWRMSDEHTGELEQLQHFRPHDLSMTEDAGAGRNWEGFDTYRDWAARGHEPPPVSVVRHADTGAMISSNRRRVLAAQDANRPHIPGWFSETERPSGRPAWNHRQMVERAIREGKQVPADVLKDYPDLRAPAPDPAPVPPSDSPAFAARAKSAAASVGPEGRFGDNKVFISHAHRAYERAHGPMPLDEFKRQLAGANNARHLDLGRADMVEAMDPATVAASETNHLGSAFHFLRDEPTRPRVPSTPPVPPPSTPAVATPPKQVARLRDDLALATERRRALNMERQRELSGPRMLLAPDREARRREVNSRHDALAAAQDAEIARLQREHDAMVTQYPELSREPVRHTRPAQFIQHGR